MNKEMLKNSGVGYWGTPGRDDATKLHLQMYNLPVCGARIAKSKVYQFCTTWPEVRLVECKHCLRIIRKAQL